MKKSVKFWVILAVLVVVGAVSFIIGCRNDVYVQPPPSLVGQYTGIYRYTEDNGATLLVNDSQFITVIINSTYFQMYLDPTVDTTRTAIDQRIACDAKAFYDIEGSVTMWYTTDILDGTSRNLTAQTCSEDRAPEGLFGLQQPADSVYLIHQETVSSGGASKIVRKNIRLKRAS